MDDVNKNLDKKIFDSIGRHKKHHQSRIDESVPNSRELLFRRPGMHGYYTYDKIASCPLLDRFEVYTESKSIGVLSHADIKDKFGL